VSLSRLFGDLPAIFARDVTQDGLQVAQGMLMNFGARKVGTQPGMELLQALVPSADLMQAWSGLRGCGMLRLLHAALLSDGRDNAEEIALLACHIGVGMARSSFPFQGKFRGLFQGVFLPF
jgi:hypothetical protein